jgi:hypothetical protein
MRFLHVNRVPELGMARCLVLHSQLDVFADMAADTMLAKRGAKARGQFPIPGQQTRLEHRGLAQHVLVREVNGLGN